jgi:hypothetical protein
MTFTDAQLKAALKESAGARAVAAQRLGVTRQAVHQRVKGNPEILAYIEEIEESLLDAAEAVVAEALVQKDRRMARWYLERKGKFRGYTTRAELTGANGSAIPVAALDVTIRYVAALPAPEDEEVPV